MKSLTGCNIKNKPIIVEHKNLERLSSESIFKSMCPACKKGILCVSRDRKTFDLIDHDRCLLCGQEFIYSDIDYLKKMGC
jgi:hypothetical protein